MFKQKAWSTGIDLTVIYHTECTLGLNLYTCLLCEIFIISVGEEPGMGVCQLEPGFHDGVQSASVELPACFDRDENVVWPEMLPGERPPRFGVTLHQPPPSLYYHVVGGGRR